MTEHIYIPILFLNTTILEKLFYAWAKNGWGCCHLELYFYENIEYYSVFIRTMTILQVYMDAR